MAGYVTEEKMAAREGRSPRDILSMNLVVAYLYESNPERVCVCVCVVLDAKRLRGR